MIWKRLKNIENIYKAGENSIMLKSFLVIGISGIMLFLGFAIGIYSSIQERDRKQYRKFLFFKTPFSLIAFIIIILFAVGFYFL